MESKELVYDLLWRLQDIIEQLSYDEFTKPIELLSYASIGQHTRYILEFFIELDKGYKTGILNYGNRSHTHRIETDNEFAVIVIKEIAKTIERPDKEIELIVDHGINEPFPVYVKTSYSGELIYTIEHALHHMASIRIGLESTTKIKIPKIFDIAASFLRYREKSIL